VLKQDHPALVDGVVPDMISLPALHKIIQLLLAERLPIRDLATIMEAVSEYVTVVKDPEVLAEYCRISLRRQISDLLKNDKGKIYCFTLSPQVEQILAESVQNTKQGIMVILPPELTEKIITETARQADSLAAGGHHPVCLTSPNVRLAFRRLVESAMPQLTVVSYNEIHRDVEVMSSGMVEIRS